MGTQDRDGVPVRPALDRRTFLFGAAALAGTPLWGANPALGRTPAGDGPSGDGTAPSPGSSPGAFPGERTRFRRAVKIGMVGEGETLLDKFRLLVDLGYDGVELDSPNDLDPDEVLAARDQSGIAIPGVVNAWHWQYTLGDPDPRVRAKGREGLEIALRDAAKYGASTVLLVPAVVNERIDYTDAHERSRAEIARVLPLAEELGVSIALENVWNHFLLSPLEAAAYVDSFRSEWVGWYLDPGNLVRNAWPVHWVRALGPRILKLDIKDYCRTKRDREGLWAGFGVEIGEGDTDWPATIAALRAIGYPARGEPWATAEVAGGDRRRLADVLARMDRFLA